MVKNSISEGLTLTYIEKIAGQLVSFVVTIILARLLMPKDYGVVAIVNVFINIADVFITSGFGNSLIQKKEISKLDYSTILLFSLILSGVLCIILFIASPAVATYYEMPVLIMLIRLMSLKLPFAAVISIEQAYISRNMLFHWQMFASLLGSIIGAVLGITMAFMNFGAVALVCQSLSSSIINAGALWLMIHKFPGLKFSKSRFKELFAFGWKLLATALIDRGYNEVRSLIIGKMFSSSDLAYYNKGQDLPSMLMSSVDSTMTRVLFPVLSKKQDQKDELHSLVSKSVSLSTYLIMPALLLFAFISDKLVLIVLTEKWMPCVPFIEIFCIYYMFTPIKSAKYQSIKAIGRTDISLMCEMIQKIFGVGILLYTVLVLKSVVAIALGNIVFTIITVVITAIICKKYVGFSYKQQVNDVVPAIIVTSFILIILKVVTIFKMEPVFELICQFFCGMLVYVIVSKIFRFKQYIMLKEIFFNLLRKVMCR